MSKETFKSFARLHPELGSYVMTHDTSWQKLFELYEIYGDSSSIWDKYLINTNIASDKIRETSTDSTIGELVNTIKKIDLNTVQKGVNNLQKTIGLLQEIGIGSSKTTPKVPYESRPMYKYFED